MEQKNISEIISRCVFVALGSFNPAIIHPEWLSRHKILPEEEIAGLFAEPIKKEIPEVDAVIEFGQYFIVSSTETNLRMKSLVIRITRNKFEIRCENPEKFSLMLDSIKKIFMLLAETPVTAYGLNFDEDMLFDKNSSEIMDNFFIKTDNVRSAFGDILGVSHNIQAKIGEAMATFVFKPSQQLENGIFFRINYHFQNDSHNTKFITERIGENFTKSKDFTEKFFSSYCGNLIEKKGIK